MSKINISSIIGFIGAVGATLFGEWDMLIQCTLIIMLVDYLTGTMVSLAFGKSTKSESGKLSSNAMFKGIVKKVIMLSFILIGYQLDLILGFDFIRIAMCCSIISMELISLMESWKISGINYPSFLDKVLDILDSKVESGLK